jgi:hypothetical protein
MPKGERDWQRELAEDRVIERVTGTSAVIRWRTLAREVPNESPKEKRRRMLLRRWLRLQGIEP